MRVLSVLFILVMLSGCIHPNRIPESQLRGLEQCQVKLRLLSVD